MKRKGLVLFTLLCSVLLVSCNEESPNVDDTKDTCTVLFDRNLNGTATYELEVPSGKSLDEVLTTTQKAELDEFVSGDETYLFDGWYTYREAATNLDDAGLFDFSTKITEDLYLCAGYTDTSINTYVSQFVETYLGIYEQFDLDPFPMMDATSFETLNDQGNKFAYENVSTINLSKYYASLTNYYGFTSVGDGVYLSKEEVYYVTYTYNSTNRELTVEIEFNDTLGSFPSYFFASSFYGIDMSYYINETTFNFANLTTVSDEDRYITYVTNDNNIRNTYIFFEPSNNYYDVLSEIEDVLGDAGFDEDTVSGYLTDYYGYGYLEVDYVSEEEVSTFRNLGLDLSTSMIKMQSIENESSLDLDTDTLEYLMYYLYGNEGLSILPYILLADAYSGIYYTYSSIYYTYYAPLYYAIGVDIDYLESYVDDLDDEGWYVSVSTSSGYTTMTLSSPTNRYQVSLALYDTDTFDDVNTTVVRVILIRNISSFDYLDNFIYQQSGNGTRCQYVTIPEFKATRFGRGTISTVTAGYYLIGYQTTLEVLNEFLDEVASNGDWVLQSRSTYDAEFISTDQSFTLTVTYRGNNIRLDLVLDATRTVDSIEEAKIVVEARLGFPINQTVLTCLENNGYDSLSILQYFDGSYHRTGVYYYYSTRAEALAAYNIMLEALEDNLTYLSTGTVVFYQDTYGSVYYTFYEEYTTGYRVGLIAYNATFS